MVLSENISKNQSFPTSHYNDHAIMNEDEMNQNQNEVEGVSNDIPSTNDENETIETCATSIDPNHQEESTIIQNKSSWDYIKEEEVNAIPDVSINNSDKFWDDVRRASLKIAIDARAKAEEIDEKYKIQEKARPYVQNFQTYAQSTRNFVEEQNIPSKAKNASAEATKQVRELDDKYGVVDKVTGAAVAIGGIQLATGHAKSGVLTLAGAALVAAFGEKLKKDREDEKELHLY